MSTDDTIRRLAAFLAKQNQSALTTTATTLSAEATREADRVAAASEPALGNPADDGYKLASTAAGRRSWVADTALSDPTTTAGDLIYRGASALARLGIGDTGKVLRVVAGLPSWATLAYSDIGAAATNHVHDDATTLTAGFFSAAEKIKLTGIAPNATANVGTVTSVGLSLPNILTVTVSPVTTSGTLTATLTSQTAGTVLAAPAGSAGTPTFRALEATDIPTLTTLGAVTTGSWHGTAINTAHGGTGKANTADLELTIPATGTAALLGTANVFTAKQTITTAGPGDAILVDGTGNRYLKFSLAAGETVGIDLGGSQFNGFFATYGGAMEVRSFWGIDLVVDSYPGGGYGADISFKRGSTIIFKVTREGYVFAPGITTTKRGAGSLYLDASGFVKKQ